MTDVSTAIAASSASSVSSAPTSSHRRRRARREVARHRERRAAEQRAVEQRVRRPQAAAAVEQLRRARGEVGGDSPPAAGRQDVACRREQQIGRAPRRLANRLVGQHDAEACGVLRRFKRDLCLVLEEGALEARPATPLGRDRGVESGVTKLDADGAERRLLEDGRANQLAGCGVVVHHADERDRRALALEAEDRRGHAVCVGCQPHRVRCLRDGDSRRGQGSDGDRRRDFTPRSRVVVHTSQLRVAALRADTTRRRSHADDDDAPPACPPNSSAPASAASWRWCGSWRHRASASSRSASASPTSRRRRSRSRRRRRRSPTATPNTSRTPGFRRSATRSPRTTPSAPAARSLLKMCLCRTARCSRSRRRSWRCSSRAMKCSCPTRASQLRAGGDAARRDARLLPAPPRRRLAAARRRH